MFQHFFYHFERHQLGDLAFDCVFRTDFSKPGFIVFEFESLDSRKLRTTMVELKHDLDRRFQETESYKLSYGWLGRFDQQETTPFHRDNAEDSSFLMLGYEPSEIPSRLMIADYSRFANDRGLTQEAFYEKWNPVYFEVDAELERYVSEADFSNSSRSKIVLVNNSNLNQNMPGVLHKAIVETKQSGKDRIINSMMINAVDQSVPDSLSVAEEKVFQTTENVSR